MAEATVRAAAMHGWDGLLAAHGVNAETSAGADNTPASAMKLADFVRFSEEAVALSRNVAVPWLAGVDYDLASLGQVGEAILAAPRAGTAIRRLVDHFALLQDATDITFERDERTASVSYRILDPDIWPRHADALFTLGIVAQILRRGLATHDSQFDAGNGWGEGWDRVELVFEAERSAVAGDMAKAVQAPVSFGADCNAIRFPATYCDLALPLAGPGPDAGELTREIVRRRRAMPVTDRLADLVYRDLNTRGIDQQRIAREIGMSSRTMRRKLADEGSSYQAVLDECRMRQAALEFRARPDLSIAQIALRLGYAEHSNFTRAFHRWSGVSPQVWRKRYVV